MSSGTTPGYVYLLINHSMPGLVKVGRTTRPPADRVQELSGPTSVPTPFVLVFDVFVPDCVSAERLLHDLLTADGYRVADNREFFEAPVHEVVRLMLTVRENTERASVVDTTPGALSETQRARELERASAEALEPDGAENWDELFRAAGEVCIRAGEGSTSLVQRRLQVGYGRAARIVDQLHEAGVVGPPNGADPREVLLGLDELEEMCAGHGL